METLNNDWRKVASTIYRKPVDSKILGQTEFDVTKLEDFISQKRKKGLKITMTHFFVLVVARCLKEKVPEFNTYIRRGKIVARKSVDAMISVLQTEGGMSAVKVPDADKMNLMDLENFLRTEIQKSRKGYEGGGAQKKNILAVLPWPFRRWFFRLYSLITLKWGLSIPGLGLSNDTFGSYLVSNIGSIGLDTGYPALLPSANFSFVLVMGGVKKKPVVINDEIVIRRMMTFTIVIDHRIADASHGGKMLRYLKQLINNPEDLK